MSQVDLAAALGVDKTAVWHWENGDSRPSIDRLPAIARALDMTVLSLVRGEKVWSLFQKALEAAA